MLSNYELPVHTLSNYFSSIAKMHRLRRFTCVKELNERAKWGAVWFLLKRSEIRVWLSVCLTHYFSHTPLPTIFMKFGINAGRPWYKVITTLIWGLFYFPPVSYWLPFCRYFRQSRSNAWTDLHETWNKVGMTYVDVRIVYFPPVVKWWPFFVTYFAVPVKPQPIVINILIL